MYQPNWEMLEQKPKKPRPAQPTREPTMASKSGIWRQTIKQHPVVTSVVIVAGVLVATLIVVVVLGYWFNWPWVGVNSGYSKMTTTPQGTNTEYSPGKTLWDWMQLLFIPVVLAIGGFLFNFTMSRNQQKTTTDNQRETALQAYLDRMSDLLLGNNTGKNAPKLKGFDPVDGDEVKQVARVRTLTVLPGLDAYRKRRVLRFLYESGLIDKGKAIVDLGGANLRGADLRGTYLRCADLSMADLREADLSGADLSMADLRGAKMNNETDLRMTNLQGAEYNMEKVEKGLDRQEKIAYIEPTQWPQGFDFRSKKAICIDCIWISSIVTTPPGPIPIKTEVTFSATFTDSESSDSHEALWVWRDGTTTPGTVTQSNRSCSVSDSHTYTWAGGYYVQIKITAKDGRTATSEAKFEVI